MPHPYAAYTTFNDSSVEIDPGAMGYWMGSITALLAPLVDAVRRYTLACGKVHADDT
ncbi:IS66 family transposase, partial [Burkholderia gladioli]|uniref:IS66 family transposase n=1 Tax=Burkholderia gladioli TaxID=28095 RepID=UPI00244595F7